MERASPVAGLDSYAAKTATVSEKLVASWSRTFRAIVRQVAPERP